METQEIITVNGIPVTQEQLEALKNQKGVKLVETAPNTYKKRFLD